MLGKTGVELPILGFGTAASGQRLTLKQAVQLYEAAYLQGGTYLIRRLNSQGMERLKAS